MDVFVTSKNKEDPNRNEGARVATTLNIDFSQSRTDNSAVIEAVLTSTHNLCFGAKIRKVGIPLQTPVLL